MVLDFIRDAALVLLGGIFDRFRGDEELGFSWKGEPQKLLDGLVTGVIAGYFTFGDFNKPFYICTALVSAAVAIGYAGGWGAITGKREMQPSDHESTFKNSGLNWWEWIFEKLGVPVRNNKHVNLFCRALVGVLITSPLYFMYGVLGPSISVFLGFMISPYLAVYLVDNNLVPVKVGQLLNLFKPHKERWSTAEFCRGIIVSLGCRLFA